MSALGFPVVDADGHVQELNIDWAARIAPAVSDRAPRVAADNRGFPRLLAEGKLWPKPEGRGTGQAGGPRSRRPAETTGMHDPVQRLKDMDLEGIDTAVLFGTSVFLSLPFFEDAELAAATARVYNDWLAEYCAAAPARLKGIALVPIQDSPAAVEELRHAVRDLGFVGVGTPAHSGGRNLDDPALDPFFAEAERLGVPVCVHVGAGRPAAAAERFTNAYMVHVVTHAFEQMIAALCVVSGGVLERHPALRVAFLEAGAGWVPYWIERLDEHYEYMQPCVPWRARGPGEYMRAEQCYYSFEPDERTLPWVLGMLGEEHVVFASDYNHSDCKFPHTVRAMVDRADLTLDQKRKLMCDNAARLYRLAVPAGR
jgi:hypothetical protein